MSSPRKATTLHASGAPDVLARLIRSLLVLMVGVDILSLIAKLVASESLDPAIEGVLSVVRQTTPIAILWLVAARTRFRKLSVLFAAAAVTFSMSGDWIYRLAMDETGYLAFPSPADAAFLMFYPLMAAALVAHVGPQLRGVGGLVLLETAVAAVGASAVLAVILDPIITNAVVSGDALASTVAIAYPASDLFVLAVIAGIAAVPTVSMGRRSWALITGLAIFTAADIVWAFMAIEGTYLNGTPLDLSWLIAIGFITWWVAGMATPDGEPLRVLRRGFPIPLSAVAVLAGVAVLVTATQTPMSLLAIVLAAATIGLSAVPVIFRQAVLRRTVAAQDEAMRQLIELDQAKTDIMVTMNHEFRTPLTSINGHVDLLLDGGAGEMPAAATQMLRTIERNGARLQGLIDETLTATQLEAGAGVFDRQPIDVSGLAADAVERLEATARQREVDLVLELAEDPLVVEADAVHLGRALANIVDNAVKFTEAQGRVTVAVGASATGDEAVVRVEDTGMGIPRQDVHRLFTRFFRASNVQSAAIPGVGLGLSITQHVVRAHGGTIEVDSTLGRGTTVTVRLPLARGGAERSRRGLLTLLRR